MAHRISDFIRDRSIQTIGDYGCGPGTFLFELANIFPEKTYFGYDISEAIIERNRKVAETNNVENIFFEVDLLPCPAVNRMFDLVTCFATLHYVEDIELAISNLYTLVKPRGYLIFNYPNVYTMRQYQKDVEPSDDYMRQRFSLVLAGKNILSYRKIRDVLRVSPRKFYSSNMGNIYVSIRR